MFKIIKSFSLLICLGMMVPFVSAQQSKDCSELTQRIESEKNSLEREEGRLSQLERRLPQLEKSKQTWNEFSQAAELGMVPTKFNDPQLVDRICKEFAEASSEDADTIGSFKQMCQKHLQPPIQDRNEAIRAIQGVYSFLSKEIEKIPQETAEVQKMQQRINDLSRQLKDCEGQKQESEWQQMLGQWVNQKGTLIVNLVYDETIGIEGRVVKVPPVWPKKLKSGVVFFRSRTNGSSPADNMQGKTLTGNCLVVPQGEDCPNLARTLRYEACTLTLNSSGDEIALKQTLRKYDPGECTWSDVTEEQNVPWLRVGAPVKP